MLTMPERPRIHVYIDETGDRGSSARSSPIFGMAAILLDQEGETHIAAAVAALRRDFKVPGGRVMSWKEDARTHDRRRRAADILASAKGVRVCYVYAVKSALHKNSYLHDPTRFYNYLAYKIYKSALWAARSWKGSGVDVWVRYGHVKHHDHQPTQLYIRREAALDKRVPDHLTRGLSWVSADRYFESQAADLYAGFLKAATWPAGEYDYVEPSYLLKVWPQIVESSSCAIPLGIMAMPAYGLLTQELWFPCSHCKK